MHKILWAGALAGLALTTPLAAQRSAGPSFGITPYAGYMKFGNLVSGPFGTSVRNAGAAVYGAEATLGLTSAIALVGNVAYSQPGLEIGAPLIGGVSVGRSTVLLYDAALRLRVPVAGGLPISPFVQGGAGAVRQSLDIGPASTHSTNFAYNVGAGADVALGRRLGLELMVKDYIGKFDARGATALNVDTKTTHNFAVSAGVRVGL
jgi:opacity protein-like surface antigen